MIAIQPSNTRGGRQGGLALHMPRLQDSCIPVLLCCRGGKEGHGGVVEGGVYVVELIHTVVMAI